MEIAEVSKRFGDRIALEEVSFVVRPGEVFGFVGGNGAGKTTAMRIMLGVLRADSGTVKWQGKTIDADVRRRIGYMPEERGLYPKMKVGEQLEYFAELHGLPRDAARRSVEEWTERLGIAEHRSDPVQKLSLGNQQRVQLCAALVHNPDALVLDEPFSGLDPAAVDTMSGVLGEKAASGVPVIFSSHQLDLVERISQSIGIIAAGRMVAVGSVEKLRSGSEIVIDVRGPSTPEWATAISGVQVLAHAGDWARIQLDGDVDDQEVLQAALAAGPVHEFSPYRPALTELYRDVVSTPRQADRRLVTV